MIENLEWNSIDEVNMMNQMEHVNRLLIVSTYALMVLMILIAQILFTLIVILFMSLSYQSNFSIASLIQTTASGLFVLIALVIALLICFVKKINETFPENVTLAIAYVRIAKNLFFFIINEHLFRFTYIIQEKLI
ncbi:hypothetical protein MS3_00008818 [Schistosoma haematobium]|uniref:Transmembrane protein n=1 Tax=Schistosoma haematobium TaxID=6185 RepID=A0A922LFD8_SCHHA|nr:hypothetical protein MS3_00008818 [Schistosoma haematobium]KAH9581783.1 hypothetical protein MS3_00008818 [Schistosoma haematobium]